MKKSRNQAVRIAIRVVCLSLAMICFAMVGFKICDGIVEVRKEK